jgi:hypothetical protein
MLSNRLVLCALPAILSLTLLGCASPQVNAFNSEWKNIESLVVGYSINENSGVQLYGNTKISEPDLGKARASFEGCIRPVVDSTLRMAIVEAYPNLGPNKIIFLKGVEPAEDLPNKVGKITLKNVVVEWLGVGREGGPNRYLVSTEAYRYKSVGKLSDPRNLYYNPIQYPRLKSGANEFVTPDEFGDCESQKNKLLASFRMLFRGL